ncbi:unnamed protein product [Jaminaea pallidilutea]
MSYQRPHDPYTHSNASQYDNRYVEQGRDGYSDYPQQGGGYHYGSSTPQSDQYYNKDGGYAGAGAGAGAAGAGAAGYGHNPAQAAAAKYSYAPAKKGKSKWVKYGIPAAIILVLIIIGAVLGGIFGSRASSNSSNGGASSGGSSFSGTSGSSKERAYNSSTADAASAAAQNGGTDPIAYQGTDLYGNPAYISAANTAAPSSTGSEVATCSDSNTPSGSLSGNALRDHPRIMTAQYEWDCLPQKIAKDAYLTVWHAQIMSNATTWAGQDPVKYDIDGTASGSGILDPARDVQQRIKAWAYAYRMTKDTKWADRAWTELQVAAGNSSSTVWSASQLGNGLAQNQTWNPSHFLDVAELTAAFAIGYDWLYDAWSNDQRTAIMWSIIQNGLMQGMEQYNTATGWWKTTNGNWNCVCNSGMMLGALAIASEDPTQYSSQILAQALPNMKGNCMTAVYPDGTWSETANYWYFGSDAQARAVSALTSSTGNDQGLSDANESWNNTGLFHMYVGGQAGLFYYGDNGPNKFSTTASGMFLWGKNYKIPIYGLYQRDRADAADPLSMFWYDTSVRGGYWNGLALDKFFDNDLGSWASMRSSWTDFTGTYIGIKSSNATGHQTHGDLDAGDFVFDALGTRWAGEYGNGNYLSVDYFASEVNGATRWQYFRKGTQGQNTLVINNADQNANCRPTNKMESTGAKQTADLDYVPGKNDVAYFTTQMGTCYNTSASNVQRGIRFLNGRRQMLVQDEITQTNQVTSVEWRMQTNASVAISSDGKTATLKLKQLRNPNAYGGAQPLIASLDEEQTVKLTLQSPSSAKFTQTKPMSRIYGTTPDQSQNPFNPPGGEQVADRVDPDVTVLSVKLDDPSGTVAVWFQPQWPNANSDDTVAPKSVPLNQWSLTSHN